VRVFVAGASGVIGRPLIAQLVAAGHDVAGMTRSRERAAAIERAGATAEVCDALDAAALRAAVAQAEPEVVVHQLTALPPRFNPRKKDLYDATNRVRIDGTRNLVEAAAGRRIVCQSIAFAYRPHAEPRVLDEDAPLFTDAPPPFGEATRAIAEMERMVLEADGIVLRYGWFYGPGTYFGEGGSMAKDVARRRFPIMGEGSGLFSFIHVDDAAAATVAAVERGAPGVYNVVDDEPAPTREWLPAYAEAIGARRPLRFPLWLARLVAGKAAAGMSTTLPAATNARAKRELGWEPRWPTWRSGFRDAPR
jgi:nucleoside-diphosphate-sugar epimerase